ncbi:MAG: hypothetical protein NTY18_03925 [Deltaproteobacteria bacterium]|nr:hypothetical protein [Deltaproteobacteria bacterium]
MTTPRLAAGRWTALALAAAGAALQPSSALGAELASIPAAISGGTVADQVVAVVGIRGGEARVITLTRVTEEGRIALVSRGGIEAAFARLDGAVLRASLDWYVDQLLLLDEAVRLQVFEVDRATSLAELARFKAEFPDPANYKAFLFEIDVTEEELVASLSRSVRVRRYLESRLGRVRAGPAEVEAWYAAHAAEFGGRPLAQVADEIAARLSSSRADAETKALLADLRGRADIRVLVDLGARP